VTDTPHDWQRLVETSPADTLHTGTDAVVQVVAEHYGISEDSARDWVARVRSEVRFFVNDLYEVALSPTGIDALQLTIQRRDGELIRDWRHFQQIKNELAGPEREAVELYPAESRKTDTANKWHLWVLPVGVKFDFGFPQRDVSYKEIHDAPGLKQRPL